MAITAVVPTYNFGRFLPACLESILQQTLAPAEIIVVDDGSTDNTRAAVVPYLADPRVRYIRIEHRGGSAARNTAIAAAHGDIIALLDADDLWREQKLELQVPLFQDPRVGVVYSGVQRFDADGLCGERTVSRLSPNDFLWAMMEDKFVANSIALVRRECYRRVGGYDERFSQSEDYHLWLRIAACGFKFDCVDQPLTMIRVGHSRASLLTDIRARTLPMVLRDVFEHPQFGRAFPPAMVRRAWASFFAGRAYAAGEVGRPGQTIASALRCLRTPAGDGVAWRVLIKAVLPH